MSNTPCRLLQTLAASGSWNMAVDEALLESTTSSGEAILRFYRWSEPTLSLGYFQKLGDRQRHAESADCPVVRRATGGGAIVHDHELTYSLVVPRKGLNARAIEQLYAQVHAGLVAALAINNIHADMFVEAPQPDRKEHVFLCFERLTSGDVVIDGHKIAGSAQRRSGGAILQHGSILLAKSDAAPELAGIREISGQQIDPDELTEVLLIELEKNLSFAFEPGELTDSESRRARSIEHKRYLDDEWTHRR